MSSADKEGWLVRRFLVEMGDPSVSIYCRVDGLAKEMDGNTFVVLKEKREGQKRDRGQNRNDIRSSTQIFLDEAHAHHG